MSSSLLHVIPDCCFLPLMLFFTAWFLSIKNPLARLPPQLIARSTGKMRRSKMSAGLTRSWSHHFLHFNPTVCQHMPHSSRSFPPLLRNPFVFPLLFWSKCPWLENRMSRSRERKSEVWGSDFQSLKFLLGETIWNVWFHERTQDIIVGWHSGWQWEHSKTIGKGALSFVQRTRRHIVQAFWITHGLGCLCSSCLIPLKMKVST